MDLLNKYLNPVLLLISLITVISGLAQLIMPSFVLETMGAASSPTAAHLFGIIGMLMALFVGLMLHTLYSTQTSGEAVLWCGLQKLGAFVAVTLGVIQRIFNPIALSVVVFDLNSAMIFLYFLKQRREKWTS